MTERQYQTSLKNRPVRGAAPLFSRPGDDGFLRSAAQASRLSERVREALANTLAPELAQGVEVVGVQDGVIEIATATAWQREALRQRLRTIENSLCKRVGGVRGVRLATLATQPSAASDQESRS